jgi:hypothetical protein
MKVYIAGPMQGIPEYNFPAFHAAACALEEIGYLVTNPAAIHGEMTADGHYALGDRPRELTKSFACFMYTDICALAKCDAVVMLQGWEGSYGARIERMFAIAADMPVNDLVDILEAEGDDR